MQPSPAFTLFSKASCFNRCVLLQGRTSRNRLLNLDRDYCLARGCLQIRHVWHPPTCSQKCETSNTHLRVSTSGAFFDRVWRYLFCFLSQFLCGFICWFCPWSFISLLTVNWLFTASVWHTETGREAKNKNFKMCVQLFSLLFFMKSAYVHMHVEIYFIWFQCRFSLMILGCFSR